MPPTTARTRPRGGTSADRPGLPADGRALVRGGYATGEDLNAFSFGIGVNHFGVALDYSYTPYDYFDAVQRVTARFSI